MAESNLTKYEQRSQIDYPVGRKYNKLTIIGSPSPTDDTGHRKIKVRCDCGTVKNVGTSYLKQGRVVSCGCYAKEISESKRKHKTEDIIGMRFGALEIIEEIEPILGSEGWATRMVSCECDCGNIIKRTLANLLNESTKTCGCFKWSKGANRTHGEAGTPLFRIWCHMRQRCQNPNDNSYQHYGAKGVTVCVEWEDYVTFRDFAMANNWSEELVMDRIEVEGNYGPGNVRFVDHGISARNRRLLHINNSTGYRGVTQRKSGKWRAIITYNYKPIHLGTFNTPIEAAQAYDAKANELGNYPLNFPGELT